MLSALGMDVWKLTTTTSLGEFVAYYAGNVTGRLLSWQRMQAAWRQH